MDADTPTSSSLYNRDNTNEDTIMEENPQPGSQSVEQVHVSTEENPHMENTSTEEQRVQFANTQFTEESVKEQIIQPEQQQQQEQQQGENEDVDVNVEEKVEEEGEEEEEEEEYDEGGEEGEEEHIDAADYDKDDDEQLSVEEYNTPPQTSMAMEMEEKVEEKKPAVESQKQRKSEESIPHPAPHSVEPEDSFISAPASWQIPPGALQAKADHANHVRLLEPIIKVNHKLERLEERVKEYPDDLEAWNALKTEIQQTGDLVQMRKFYEKFLAVFPTSPRQWLAYLEMELKHSNFNEVEGLFRRCLKTVLSIDLWKFYLGYIRRINMGENGAAATPEGRTIIEKAYEYVLNNVGIDKEAGPIWADYIFFLSSNKTTNTWEEQRKMDSMRRAYQKAMAIPLNNVEHLWKEYDQWENTLNRLTAKKFLSERSSAYMTARTALREMRGFTDQLSRTIIPRRTEWTDKDLQQLEVWREYIQWEKGNPLHLEDEEAVVERVAYAYQQAFLVLRFFPVLWFDYAMYYKEIGKVDKALTVLKQGMEILPTSLLIHFAYAELCESRKQFDEARQAFDSLLEQLDQDIEKLKSTAQKSVEKLQQEAEEEKSGMNLSDDIDGELREQLRQREKQIKKEQDEIEERVKEQVDGVARSCSLVWIMYMRFARRSDGIKSARSLFSRARKTTNLTYHLFVASALMEYHNSKDATIAGKVFEIVGYKLFADDPAFVCEYLDFLIEMNDDNNTRALFERALSTMPAEKAGPIWSKFLDYENKYGDLAGVQGVEKRRNEAIQGTTVLESSLFRYSYLDIGIDIDSELGGEARKEKSPNVAQSPVIQEATVSGTTGHERSHRNKDHGKKPLLQPVHPEKYPRPDFEQWKPFKPLTDSARHVAPNTVTVPRVVAPDSVPKVSTPTPDVPPVAAAPAPPVTWNKTQSTDLPGPIAYFVSSLPPAHSFNGPSIQAGELADLLRNIIVPVPAQLPAPGNTSGTMVAPGRNQNPQSHPKNIMNGPPMHSQQQMAGRDMPPIRGIPGNRAGRGGFKTRGGGMPMRGGKGNMKRKTRDDHEDDYMPHKGMGPNRPPDNDIFRARQVKRHRDDPPY